MENRSVSEIFAEPPVSWGLWGDSYFWEDLKQHFKEFPLPYPEDKFIDEIIRFFKEKTGESLTPQTQVYVPEYAGEGMSAGIVSGAYWTGYGIPLLVEKLRKANADAEQQSPKIFSYEKRIRADGIGLLVFSSLILVFMVTFIGLTIIPFPYIIRDSLFTFTMVLIICIPSLIKGIQQIRLHSGTIKIYDGCIEYRRGQKYILVPFEHVERVTFPRMFFHAIKLHTRQGPILIGKKIQGYQKLYAILAENIEQLKPIPESPLIVRIGIFITTYGATIFGVFIFFLLVYISVRYSYSPSSILSFIVVVGVFSALFTMFLALSRPYKYRFDNNGITKFVIASSEFHPKDSIKAVYYGQIEILLISQYRYKYRYRKIERMVNYIRLDFSDRRSVIINDSFSKYPIEQIVRYVKEVYGIMPIYRNVEEMYNAHCK